MSSLVDNVLKVPGDVSIQAIRQGAVANGDSYSSASNDSSITFSSVEPGRKLAPNRSPAPAAAPAPGHAGAPGAAPSPKASSAPSTVTVGVTIAPNASEWGSSMGQLNAGWMEAVLVEQLAKGQPASSMVWLADAPQLSRWAVGRQLAKGCPAQARSLTCHPCWRPYADPMPLPPLLTLHREGVCGNAICEVGERAVEGATLGSCPQDCGLPSLQCPAAGCGSGYCMQSAGQCECWVGYSGPTCANCASGYQPSANGCVPDVVALGLAQQPVAPAPALPAPAPAPTTDGSSNVTGGADGACVGQGGACMLLQCLPGGAEHTWHVCTLAGSTDAGASDAGAQASQGVNVGAIVGGVLGGIAALGIAAWLFFCCRRRRTGANVHGGALQVARWQTVGVLHTMCAHSCCCTSTNAAAPHPPCAGYSDVEHGHRDAHAAVRANKLDSSTLERQGMEGKQRGEALPSEGDSMIGSFQPAGAAAPGGQQLAGGDVDVRRSMPALPVAGVFAAAAARDHPLRRSEGSLREAYARSAASSGGSSLQKASVGVLQPSYMSRTPAMKVSEAHPARHASSTDNATSGSSGEARRARAASDGAAHRSWSCVNVWGAAGTALELFSRAAGTHPACLCCPGGPSAYGLESSAALGGASMLAMPAASLAPQLSGAPSAWAGAPATDAASAEDQHYMRLMMRSYTVSPLDARTRLFYNPAFGADDVAPMSARSSIFRCG